MNVFEYLKRFDVRLEARRRPMMGKSDWVRELKRLLEGAGVEVVRVKYTGYSDGLFPDEVIRVLLEVERPQSLDSAQL